ncbi:methylthioribulose 1-phosphate dehydratase [Micromonospora sp. NPDC048947]|uniref:methylthioribulose 1-phosphate dehydratase n=1 Tax=Micromonospora sp. NPDC048947 TaxID=3154826 RepID=UPI0033CDBEDC
MTGIIDTRGAAHLVGEARELYLRGWLEGTSGNLSTRLDDASDTILITTSGRSKGRLTESDTVPVSVRTGLPVRPIGPKPSAETSIHTAIYAADPRCGAVIHVHSPHATAVAVLAARASRTSVRFADLELIKGLGVVDPASVHVPVFPNWPDVARVGTDVTNHLAQSAATPPVFLLAWHGVTAWGPSLEVARNRLECLEAMCQLTLLAASASPNTDLFQEGLL